MNCKFIQTVKHVFTNIDWLNIDPATYVRYILMILSIVNTVLTRAGLNPIPFDEDSSYMLISDIITICILVVNTYKNNSITPEAIAADKIMKEEKLKNIENNI